MYRKMLSMTVALMLILSVFAAMPAMAAGESVAFYSNFESDDYVIGEVLNDASLGWEIIDTDYMTTEIIAANGGYDGQSTKAMKIKVVNDGVIASGNASSNKARIEPKGIEAGWPNYSCGTFMVEYDVFVDDNWMFQDAIAKTDTAVATTYGYARFGYTELDNGKHIGVRGGSSTYPDWATLRDGWNRIKMIYHSSSGTATTSMTLFLNDVLVKHKESHTRAPITARIQFNGDAFYSKDDYLIIDNFRLAYAPDATTVSSGMNGATGVSVDTNEITLNFSERVLETLSSGAHDVVPADFVVLGGVEVEEVTVAADRKSVTLTLDRELEYETTYTVSIAENALMDMYSNYITGSVSFTTEERPAFEPTKPVFKKEYLFTGGEGKVLNKLENGYVSCQYSLTNNTAEDKNALMFVVLWENGKIKGFMFNPQVMAANGGVANLYGGFNVADANNTKIEAYAWEGFLSMSPLMPKFTINKDGIAGTGVIEE